MTDSHKDYSDIINMPHHVSLRHPQMQMSDRAAQFSPFAALTGHDEAITETARLTETWTEPDDDIKQKLDETMSIIRSRLKDKPEVSCTCFRPDDRKSGGAYITLTGKVKKIDEFSHRIFLYDDKIIDTRYIISLEINDIDEIEGTEK
jgi:hypothetical protein